MSAVSDLLALAINAKRKPRMKESCVVFVPNSLILKFTVTHTLPKVCGHLLCACWKQHFETIIH